MRLRRFLGWALVVLAGWYASLAIVSLMLPAGRPLLVFAPGRALAVAKAGGGTFEGGSASFAYTRSDDPDHIYTLYANGALLVLDGKTVQSCRTLVAQAFSKGP